MMRRSNGFAQRRRPANCLTNGGTSFVSAIPMALTKFNASWFLLLRHSRSDGTR